MAKRVIPVVSVAVLLALAAWLAPGLLDAPSDVAPGQTAADLANPPIGGSLAKFTPASSARPAPTAAFRDGAGRQVSLGDFRGKLVLLNFWATWCAPCLRELPSLDHLQGAAGSERFSVLALSIDRDGVAAVTPFYEQLAIQNLAIHVDPENSVGRAFGIKGLPHTVLIGPDGAILGELLGPAEWDSAAARALIDFYLTGLAPAAPERKDPASAGSGREARWGDSRPDQISMTPPNLRRTTACSSTATTMATPKNTAS